MFNNILTILICGSTPIRTLDHHIGRLQGLLCVFINHFASKASADGIAIFISKQTGSPQTNQSNYINDCPSGLQFSLFSPV